MSHKYSGLYCPICAEAELDANGDHWPWCEYELNEAEPPITKEESLKQRVAKQQGIAAAERKKLKQLKRELAAVTSQKDNKDE